HTVLTPACRPCLLTLLDFTFARDCAHRVATLRGHPIPARRRVGAACARARFAASTDHAAAGKRAKPTADEPSPTTETNTESATLVATSVGDSPGCDETEGGDFSATASPIGR